MHRKPGVILLPVSAVFLIFIVLLVLLINQKQSNNALDLEYRASRIINLLLDLYTTEQEIDSAEIDANILGYGFYDEDRNALQREGTAPPYAAHNKRQAGRHHDDGQPQHYYR